MAIQIKPVYSGDQAFYCYLGFGRHLRRGGGSNWLAGVCITCTRKDSRATQRRPYSPSSKGVIMRSRRHRPTSKSHGTTDLLEKTREVTQEEKQKSVKPRRESGSKRAKAASQWGNYSDLVVLRLKNNKNQVRFFLLFQMSTLCPFPMIPWEEAEAGMMPGAAEGAAQGHLR